jgi:HAE1 family hydrophobic/amphiphilic exporter-1
MKTHSYKIYTILFAAVLVFAAVLGIDAQDAKPSPTPTPAGDKIKDVQDVKPEGVKGVPDIAKEFKSDERDLPDIGRVGVDMLTQKPLGLREAIVKGLENNIDIEVTRQDVKLAEFDLQAADGSYEPRFTGQTFYERSTAPNISIFSSNKSTTLGSIAGNARYEAYLRDTGTIYYGELSNQHVTSTNPISILSPQYNTSLSFGIVQPLFNGRKFDERRRVIEIAKKNLSLTDTQFRQKAIEVTATIQRAYWDLTYALKNLQVQRDGVRDAKDQLEHNKRLVKEGVLAPVDVIASQTQVANLELQVYAALESVNRAENLLKGLISGDRDEAIWNQALVPTDSVDLKIPRTSLSDALSLALDNRPELASLNFSKEINEINQRLYREQDKPQIDLTASFSTSGVSGSFNSNFQTPFQSAACQLDPTGPQCMAEMAAIRTSAESFTGGYQSTLTDMAANRYPTYRVGITFTLPVAGGRTAKANLGKSLVEGEKISSQRRQLEQLIQMDVRNALQSVRTSEARLRSAAISRQNSDKQYESEKRKLDSGLSDIYKVLERQTALMNARSAEIQAQTELNKSIAELQRATGNSLKANEVETKLRR